MRCRGGAIAAPKEVTGRALRSTEERWYRGSMRHRRRASALLAAILLATASVGAPSGPSDDIPFRTPSADTRLILLDVRLGGRGPFTALLDTGNAAPFVVILSPRAAAQARARLLKRAPFVTQAVIGPATVSLDQALLPALEVGPIRRENVTAGISSVVEVAAGGLARRFDAVLGYEFLKGRTLLVDYPCRRIRFAAATPATMPTAPIVVAPVRPLTLVSATVNGRGPYRLVLDTGAGDTLLSPAAAAAAGVRPLGPLKVHGAGGAERAAFAWATVRLGNAPPRRVRVALSGAIDRVGREAGARIDGVAGTALFADGRVVLDYVGKKLWLQKPRPCRQL